jgi:hypothetical protein
MSHYEFRSEILCRGAEWIRLAQDADQWQVAVNVVVILGRVKHGYMSD